MTKKQERIAEFIIQAHKDNNGVYEWDDYITQYSSNDSERLVIARELKDRNFINGQTRLKKAGWDFNGFDIERENSIEQKRISDKKDKYDLLTKEFIYKMRYIPYLLSLLALIISVFSYCKKS